MSLVDKKQIYRAEKYFQEMTVASPASDIQPVEPNIVTLNTIIGGYATARDLDSMKKYWNMMVNELKLVPNRITFHQMIKGYQLVGDIEGIEEMWKLIRETNNSSNPGNKIELTPSLYCMSIEAYLAKDMLEKADVLLNEMKKQGFSVPDKILAEYARACGR